MISRRRRIFRLVLATLAVLFGLEQAWRHGYDYILPEKFAAVDEGKVYRGAWQMTWPMKRIVREHDIKTVIALAHPPESPWVQSEQELADEMGFRFVHLPIVDDRSIGDDEALFDLVEQAAAEVADPANQPVYFHCHHGVNRASMVHMAYRMLYCGYTIDEAEAEVAEQFGLKAVDKGPDYRHMRAFYESRVLPRRRLASPAEEPARQ
jgi:protein tyrosine phosphatase (PTP) superfamily phosphohydrolase (DUF442 family)